MTNTVLIVGASGLVGTAAAIEFANAGWRVMTASRRFPELLEGKAVEHVTLDLMDGNACRQVVSDACADVTHLIYTAVFEKPGLIEGWTDPEQIDTNDQMLRNVLEPLRENAKLKHVSLLQGTKAYGLTVGPIRIPARESQPRVEHPNFYWRQEDYLRDVAVADDLAFTIFRPQLIVGPNHGVVMNIPPVLGVYGAIRRELGLPFSFPNNNDWVWEAVDVRLVAEALRWATATPQANGETYNLTNGEVFSFRDMRPAIAVGTTQKCPPIGFNPYGRIEFGVCDYPDCAAQSRLIGTPRPPAEQQCRPLTDVLTFDEQLVERGMALVPRLVSQDHLGVIG